MDRYVKTLVRVLGGIEREREEVWNEDGMSTCSECACLREEKI